MKIKIFGYWLVIGIEKIEKPNLKIDQQQRENDFREIAESETFQNIREQARRARELRQIANTEFGQKYIENISKC